jgi:membrane fusion protein (multidrug efflux system)
MNWKKIIAILAGVALVVAFVFKLKSNKEIAIEKIYHYDKEQAIQVEAHTLTSEEIDHQVVFSGNFDANKETKISAETQGKVNRVFVDAGDYVLQGQTLVQLDNSLLKLQLQSVDVQIEGLEMDVNRYTILAQSEAIKGVQLEKTTLGLRTAKIQKLTLQEQISKSTIKAPFSGIVTMQFTEVGAFAAPGIPLLQITDIAILKFTVNVAENDLSLFQKSDIYTVTGDIYPNQPLMGKATMIGSKANMGGSYPIQFTVTNLKGSKIKAGMFGKVSLQNKAVGKGFLIPSSAIIGSSSDPQVYLVKDGKAQLQSITVSQKIQNKSVISNGIKEGDIVVTNGLINLFDGANVSFN